MTTIVTRLSLLAMIGKPCPYCGEPMEQATLRAPSRDHIKPKHHGGTLDEINRVIVCRRCNEDKGSRSLKRFLKVLIRESDPRAERVAEFLAQHIERKARQSEGLGHVTE